MITDVDIEKRSKQLSELQDYIRTTDSTITMILQSINWDRSGLKDVTTVIDPNEMNLLDGVYLFGAINHLPQEMCPYKSKELVPCKIDVNHRIPAEKFSEHTSKCQLHHDGYMKNEVLLPESNLEGPNTIKLSALEIQQIIQDSLKNNTSFKRGASDDVQVPQTASRLFSTYTSDERKAIYDYVISKTPKVNENLEMQLLSLKFESSSETPKTELELLAQSRDMKRRRAKYKVSTKSKSYTDILKEVIENQMSMYQDWLNIKNTESKIDHDKSHHSMIRSEQSIFNKKYTNERKHKHKSSNSRKDSNKFSFHDTEHPKTDRHDIKKSRSHDYFKNGGQERHMNRSLDKNKHNTKDNCNERRYHEDNKKHRW